MTAYQAYFDNKLADDVFDEERVNKALANLPNVERKKVQISFDVWGSN